MDRIIYTAMTGASAAANRQATLSNNLANASTNGFRAELDTYRAVPLRGDGATTRVFALEATATYSNLAGPAMRTDRNLDAMNIGNTWFAVSGLDGNEGYTRNGHFEVGNDGSLQTGNGLQVLSSGGGPLIIPQGAEVTIQADGNVSARVGNQPAEVVGKLKIVSPQGEDTLRRNPDGLFRTPTSDPLPDDPNARVQVGVLEGSNVSTVETMVGMIQTARQFEVQMRMLQTAESNDRSAGQLLSLQG
ncbi:flagellar basal body rod protein FlgF [Curvibacter sp. CHRR-16]|uniref:flagellar basal body rod protein FlgF n=1 Tax=Curvibacter sp. CHRR-16 TaxID=2835872 RepID=UPI001BDA397C|nr:flagellar basal body rod protein FlgF [Curvibacter sp. CHRR-16]MBT0569550.1 flagellar basal body rod protein FlgF [Curvibacter sp. CHRR-16]